MYPEISGRTQDVGAQGMQRLSTGCYFHAAGAAHWLQLTQQSYNVFFQLAASCTSTQAENHTLQQTAKLLRPFTNNRHN